jgi:hypothetical protein
MTIKRSQDYASICKFEDFRASYTLLMFFNTIFMDDFATDGTIIDTFNLDEF